MLGILSRNLLDMSTCFFDFMFHDVLPNGGTFSCEQVTGRYVIVHNLYCMDVLQLS